MTRRKVFFIALSGIVLVAAIAFVRLLPANRTAAESGAGTKQKGTGRGGDGPLPVYTQTIQPRALQERITATGTVAADEAVDLVSELSGTVVSISFEEGSRVQRGDVLLKLDDTELRAEVARAEARANLARAQATRQTALIEGGGTSRENLETARSEVQVLEAEVALARAQLAKTELRAPFDGVIGLRYVSEGTFVTPATRIATLQNLDTIKVDFNIAERYLGRVGPGTDVRISVEGLNGPFTGKIYAIEPRVDPATRTLRLRARAENPRGQALPGGFATVEVPLREIPDALMVPATAIVAGLNQQQVYVLEQGRAQARDIETGLRLAREVQIVSGLDPGAVVITSGQMQLRPGIAVEPVEPPKRDAAAAAAVIVP